MMMPLLICFKQGIYWEMEAKEDKKVLVHSPRKEKSCSSKLILFGKRNHKISPVIYRRWDF